MLFKQNKDTSIENVENQLRQIEAISVEERTRLFAIAKQHATESGSKVTHNRKSDTQVFDAQGHPIVSEDTSSIEGTPYSLFNYAGKPYLFLPGNIFYSKGDEYNVSIGLHSVDEHELSPGKVHFYLDYDDKIHVSLRPYNGDPILDKVLEDVTLSEKIKDQLNQGIDDAQLVETSSFKTNLLKYLENQKFIAHEHADNPDFNPLNTYRGVRKGKLAIDEEGNIYFVKIIKHLKNSPFHQAHLRESEDEMQFAPRLDRGAPGVVATRDKLQGDPSSEEDISIIYSITPFKGHSSFDMVAENKLSPLQTIELALQYMLQTYYLEDSHILHRDYKPQNFAALVKDDELKVSILDFGFALQLSSDVPYELQSYDLLGTIDYLPPRLLKIAENNNSREESERIPYTYNFATEMYATAKSAFLILNNLYYQAKHHQIELSSKEKQLLDKLYALAQTVISLEPFQADSTSELKIEGNIDRNEILSMNYQGVPRKARVTHDTLLVALQQAKGDINSIKLSQKQASIDKDDEEIVSISRSDSAQSAFRSFHTTSSVSPITTNSTRSFSGSTLTLSDSPSTPRDLAQRKRTQQERRLSSLKSEILNEVIQPKKTSLVASGNNTGVFMGAFRRVKSEEEILLKQLKKAVEKAKDIFAIRSAFHEFYQSKAANKLELENLILKNDIIMSTMQLDCIVETQDTPFEENVRAQLIKNFLNFPAKEQFEIIDARQEYLVDQSLPKPPVA